MKKYLLFILLFVAQIRTASAQAPIVSCPADTNALFEITLQIFQYYDSTGKVQINASYGRAVPNYFEPGDFIHPETQEPCTPYNILIQDGEIYIMDPAYVQDSLVPKRYRIDQDHVRSLIIWIHNATDQKINLAKVSTLQNLRLPIESLRIEDYMSLHPTALYLHIPKWKFIKLPHEFYGFYMFAHPHEKKKTVLRQLSRFSKIERIEVH